MSKTRGVGVKLSRFLGLILRIDTWTLLSEGGVMHAEVLLQ